jgi:hypothetical protein
MKNRGHAFQLHATAKQFLNKLVKRLSELPPVSETDAGRSDACLRDD